MDPQHPQIKDLATADRLLVVSDFDGTLAGHSTDIYRVPVNRDSLAALTRLAGLPGTHVAVLSGRHLEGLTQVCTLCDPVVLAGSHGAESSHGVELTDEMRAHLDHLTAQLEPIMAGTPGALVEHKPFQRVAHVAAVADREVAAELLARAAGIDAGGARVTPGKNIIEFSVADVTKGTWIAAEIGRLSPDRALFLGDDRTDEDGFHALRPQDLGVKVGEGDTAAAMRVDGLPDVARVLTELADARADHLGIPRDPAARFGVVAAGFSGEVARVTDWDAPTPCADWAARDIVDHLLTWYPANLRNAGIDLEVPRSGDPAADWTGFVTAVSDLLADPARAEAVVTAGPDEGQTVARATSGFLIPDIFLHTWDLARSQGNDAHLNADYAARNLAGLESLGDGLQATGQFGPPHPVAEDAPVVDRLMAHIGRDPQFRGGATVDPA